MDFNKWVKEKEREISPSYEPMRGQTVIKMLPKYELGEWAWNECESTLECYLKREIGLHEFGVERWTLKSFAYACLTSHTQPYNKMGIFQIAVCCLGEKEIEKRLKEFEKS